MTKLPKDDELLAWGLTAGFFGFWAFVIWWVTQ